MVDARKPADVMLQFEWAAEEWRRRQRRRQQRRQCPSGSNANPAVGLEPLMFSPSYFCTLERCPGPACCWLPRLCRRQTPLRKRRAERMPRLFDTAGSAK